MSRKFYFSFLAFALMIVATVAFVIARGTRAASASAALSALPASDFVVGIDAQRALNETLPSLLASNPTLLAKVNAKIDEFEKKTGINPRSIESIAIGGRFNHLHSGANGVLIARGSFNSDALIDAAFKAASEKAQLNKEEQEYQGRKIFLIREQRRTQSSAESKSDGLAVTALDANTIAAGDLRGVEAAIDASQGRDRVDDHLVQLATQMPNAIVSYSGKLPQNMSEKVVGPGNDQVAKYFASIREFYGSYSVDGTDADNIITLRTETADQARDISQAINGFKTLAAVGLSQSTGSNSAQSNALANAIQGLIVTAQDSEVRIEMKIPQASLASFMHMH
jgi:hypothetical protein